MMNQEQDQFFSALETALKDGSFRRVTFAPRDTSKDKASYDLVVGETKTLLHSSLDGSTRPLDAADFHQTTKQSHADAFRSATIFTSARDIHYTENRKGIARFYTGKATMRNAVQPHNRAKNYVLQSNRPYLHALGVTDRDGRIIKKYHPKFRQIANFVEIIDRDIGDFVATANKPISMLDLGCGKGYLTFAAYDYLQARARHTPVGQGIDIKDDVIAQCNSISSDVGFEGLNFTNARIDANQPDAIDILIALHACDTATDDALALGVRADMKFLFCAPCCQAQIARQIGNADTVFDTISSFALMRRRQADLVTDTARALILTALGYETKFLEFTPLEHTAKNVMLAGKQSNKVDRKKAWTDYLALKQASGFTTHALEQNLKDLLP